jgi:hypothetical protein
MNNRHQTVRAKWKAGIIRLEERFPRLSVAGLLALAAVLLATHYTFGEWIHNPRLALWREPAFWADVPKYIVWPVAVWGGWSLLSLGKLKSQAFVLGLAALICLGDAVFYAIPHLLRSIENLAIYRFDPPLDKWHWYAYWYRWTCWMPTALIVGNLVLLKRWWRLVVAKPLFSKSESSKTEQVSHSRFAVGVAALVAWGACLMTAVHLGLPRLPANEDVVSATRAFLVKPHLRNDFDYMIRRSFSAGQSLVPLLTQLELADLQRRQFYPNLDETTFQQYVLSPQIDFLPLEELDWRRALWEEFYPRVRRESDPIETARIVVRLLRERVGVDPGYDYRVGIETIWTEQMTDESGFERIYVAALRSVGIASRLNESGQAELLEGSDWQPAPRAVASTFLPEKSPVPEGGLVNFRN